MQQRLAKFRHHCWPVSVGGGPFLAETHNLHKSQPDAPHMRSQNSSPLDNGDQVLPGAKGEGKSSGDLVRPDLSNDLAGRTEVKSTLDTDLLTNDGLTMFRASTRSSLEDLSEILGRPIKSTHSGVILDALEARDASEAHPKSLSGAYGRSAFPLHTDCANFGVPPRYVVLANLSRVSMEIATTALDTKSLSLEDEMRQGLAASSWWIWTGKKQRLGSVLSLGRGDLPDMWRYDPTIMKPATEGSERLGAALRAMLEKGDVKRILYPPWTAVALDNWRILHGRERVENERRIIHRIVFAG